MADLPAAHTPADEKAPSYHEAPHRETLAGHDQHPTDAPDGGFAAWYQVASAFSIGFTTW